MTSGNRPLDQLVRANGLGVVFAADTGFKISGNPDAVRAPDTDFVQQKRVEAVPGWTLPVADVFR